MISKYKVNEVAKDFNKNAKDITELLARFFEEPKKVRPLLTAKSLTLFLTF